jgi:broad specificity phosphatase PhoE
MVACLYRGNLLDNPLSEKGWQQMQASVNGKHWDFIATSPMARCQAFAQHLSAIQNIELQVFDSLKEIGFGEVAIKSQDACICCQPFSLKGSSSKFPRYKRPPSGSPCLNKSRIIRGFALLTLSD